MPVDISNDETEFLETKSILSNRAFSCAIEMAHSSIRSIEQSKYSNRAFTN